MADQQEIQQDKNVSRIAVISQQIREALRKALPAPPEQFFHVMVPGKVVNFKDFTGGMKEDGDMKEVILPREIELNQAMLCDDMPTLAPVQLGPTGRSVSRSYAATLSKLVPASTTVGVEVLDPDNLSEAEKRYQKAMEWLLAEDERNPGKTHLDSYILKQKLYSEAEARKIKMYNDAYDRCTRADDPIHKTTEAKRVAYDKWVSENARKLRNDVEGAYKDWVIHGRKEAVEYWFAVVDNDSAMARVEQSKEAMRNSTVFSTDGSVEYPKVALSPSNWAWIALNKMKSGTDQTKTVDQLSWEIVHLQKKATMIQTMIEHPPVLLGADGSDPKVPEEKQANIDLGKATQTYLEKVTERDNLRRKIKPDNEANKAALEKASGEANEAKSKLDEALKAYDKGSVERLNAMTVKELNSLYQAPKESLKNTYNETLATIDKRKKQMEDLVKANVGDAVLNDILPPDAPKKAPTDSDKPDYFTPITVEISASSAVSKTSEYSAQRAKSSSSRRGWWWGGRSSSESSSESSAADAESQMANSDVKVSFECMRVDINRPWMRPELFYDDDLRAAPGSFISPGPMRLAALMDPDNHKHVDISKETREQELERFGTFPLYPTAFLLACNVVLEISGETAAIQRHFDESSSSSSSRSKSWWFGPVNSESSSSHDKNATASCQTTANGCRITIKSPQIIGWVSQMVPTLPRINNPNLPELSGRDTSASNSNDSTGQQAANEVPANRAGGPAGNKPK